MWGSPFVLSLKPSASLAERLGISVDRPVRVDPSLEREYVWTATTPGTEIPVSRIFYGPVEWFVSRTSAKTRRAINFWLLALWIVPGTVIWYLLRDVLWFVGFMSIYAIWTGHLGALSAETPVEEEAPD